MHLLDLNKIYYVTYIIIKNNYLFQNTESMSKLILNFNKLLKVS